MDGMISRVQKDYCWIWANDEEFFAYRAHLPGVNPDTNILEQFKAGQRVAFDVLPPLPAKKRPRAVNIRLLDAAPAGERQ
jgi:hypothetical protein